MSYQLLAWLLAGTFLTCCGCVVAVVGERRRARRLAALIEEMTVSEREEPRTRAKFEEFVRELSAKLAKTEADCKRVLGANEQIAKELEARTAALRSVEFNARTHNDALAQLHHERDSFAAQAREQREQLERDAARIAELETQVRSGDEFGHNTTRESSQALQHAQRQLEIAQAGHAAENEGHRLRAQSLEADLALRTGELRESRQHQSELSERVHGLELELARRDEALRERTATLDSVRSEWAAKSRELGTFGERCEELELHLEQQVDSEQRRVLELEARVEARDVQLRTQAASLESLQLALAAKSRAADDAGRRCDEFEQRAQARDAELRAQLADVLALKTDLGVKDLGLEDLGRRCQGLEQHVLELKGQLADGQRELAQRSAEIARQHDQESEAVRAAQNGARDMECRLAERIGDLETALEVRERELGAARAEGDAIAKQRGSLEHELREHLARGRTLDERCEITSQALEMRGRELLERDQRLADVAAQLREAHAEVQRSRSASEADRGPLDELVNGRLSTLFRRRADQVVATLPEPYVAGLAKKDLSLALRGLLGEAAPLSAPAFDKLSLRWQDEYRAWKRQPIERQVAYLWADGVHVKNGPTESSPSLLMVLAGFVDGTREVLAVEAGERGSVDVWRDALHSLVERGMNTPRLVVADGDLGIWPAVAELGWSDVQQYCWDHEIERAIAALPKCRRRRAGELLQKISEGETRTAAAKLKDLFLKRYCAHRPQAGERVRADWAQMSRFFALPKEHWHHLRTVGVVGSPLESMRLDSLPPKAWERIDRVDAVLWKLAVVAAKTLRPLDGAQLLPSVTAGESSVDGVRRRRSAAA